MGRVGEGGGTLTESIRNFLIRNNCLSYCAILSFSSRFLYVERSVCVARTLTIRATALLCRASPSLLQPVYSYLHVFSHIIHNFSANIQTQSLRGGTTWFINYILNFALLNKFFEWTLHTLSHFILEVVKISVLERLTESFNII